MAAKAGGYYGSGYQGFKGATQGDLLSPTIFNVVVDVVVRDWAKAMVEGADEQSGHRQYGRHQNALFYLENGMVGSSNSIWLQGAFSTLVGLFDRVGLKTNIGKTVGMVCHLCQASGRNLEAVYKRWMTGAGPSYRERHRVWVQCTECGEEMALGSLAVHLQMQHGKATGARRNW